MSRQRSLEQPRQHLCRSTAGAVESDQVVVAIFDPDPTDEALLAVPKRRDVEDEAARFAKELSADVREFVSLSIESPPVGRHHRGEGIPDVGRARDEAQHDAALFALSERTKRGCVIDLELAEE